MEKEEQNLPDKAENTETPVETPQAEPQPVPSQPAPESPTENPPQEAFTLQIKKDHMWRYATFLLAAVVLIGAFMMFTGDDSPATPTARVVDNPSGNLPTQPSQVTISADDDPILGDPDAKVTIIEFSDYQCPYCGRFWGDTLSQLKTDYIETGKANLVFRDFPLTSIHPLAQPASEAAECVREQGGDEAYYEYHDKIFENQQSLSMANLKSWATELGYDIDSCLDSGDHKDEVQKDLRDGSSAGITGTPGFFVLTTNENADITTLQSIAASQPSNIKFVETSDGAVGLRISGAFPYSTFQQAIDASLA